jgi:hypothetical protein
MKGRVDGGRLGMCIARGVPMTWVSIAMTATGVISTIHSRFLHRPRRP